MESNSHFINKFINNLYIFNVYKSIQARYYTCENISVFFKMLTIETNTVLSTSNFSHGFHIITSIYFIIFVFICIISVRSVENLKIPSYKNKYPCSILCKSVSLFSMDITVQIKCSFHCR